MRLAGLWLLACLVLPGGALAAEQVRFDGEPLEQAVRLLGERLGVALRLGEGSAATGMIVSTAVRLDDADSALASLLRGYDYFVVTEGNVQIIHVIGVSSKAAEPREMGPKAIKAVSSPGASALSEDIPAFVDEETGGLWVERVGPEGERELVLVDDKDDPCPQRWQVAPTGPDGANELIPNTEPFECSPER